MSRESQLDLFGEAAARRTLVVDVETQRSFAEVGGRDRLRDLGISVAVAQELPGGEFRTYLEKDLPRLVDDLFAADLVVGFNIKRFDYPVLSAYTDRALGNLPTLDLLEEFERSMGFRIKLDSIAEATLGRKKTGEGLQAIQWYKEGKLDRIAEYCRADVAITSDLYRYGKDHGKILYPDRQGRVRECPVRW